MSRFLETSKKLSTNPRDKILANDIPIISVYFFIFFIVFLSIKEPDRHHGHPKDDILIFA